MSTGRCGVAVRTSDSQSRNPVSSPLAVVWKQFRLLRCVSSALNVYLATYSGGYVNEQCTNCSVAECFPEMSSWHWIELVCQGMNCYTFLSVRRIGFRAK